jgi:hypothetical protein
MDGWIESFAPTAGGSLYTLYKNRPSVEKVALKQMSSYCMYLSRCISYEQSFTRSERVKPLLLLELAALLYIV